MTSCERVSILEALVGCISFHSHPHQVHRPHHGKDQRWHVFGSSCSSISCLLLNLFRFIFTIFATLLAHSGHQGCQWCLTRKPARDLLAACPLQPDCHTDVTRSSSDTSTIATRRPGHRARFHVSGLAFRTGAPSGAFFCHSLALAQDALVLAVHGLK